MANRSKEPGPRSRFRAAAAAMLAAAAIVLGAGFAAAQNPPQKTILEAQRLLVEQGYQPGRVDGDFGGNTAAAIRQFEQDWGLTPTGQITQAVLDRLRGLPPARVEIAGAPGCFILSPRPLARERVAWSGACRAGRPDGPGKLTWTYRRNGAEAVTSIEGVIVAGRFEGPNTEYLAPDGSIYRGDYRAGRAHGVGTLETQSGERYEGEWAEGVPHGAGVWTTREGDRFDGRWAAGAPAPS